MSGAPCPCGCAAPPGQRAHAVSAALAVDDLDMAIERGLVDVDACQACAPGCRQRLLDAKAGRLAAWAARERHRLREARLRRLADARTAPRATPPPPGGEGHRPPLPDAAAAALARARARAAARGKS
ncbi:hypothetical protein GCM10027359_28440 [Marilutibacter aestuarii]